MLRTKCTMVWRTSTVCYPHCYRSARKRTLCVPRREANQETCVAAGKLANNRATSHTTMLEAVQGADDKLGQFLNQGI